MKDVEMQSTHHQQLQMAHNYSFELADEESMLELLAQREEVKTSETISEYDAKKRKDQTIQIYDGGQFLQPDPLQLHYTQTLQPATRNIPRGISPYGQTITHLPTQHLQPKVRSKQTKTKKLKPSASS